MDERTLRRYAEHLADVGIPVQSQRGRYGGYRLAPSYKLPPLMLTEDEALVVVLGIEAGHRSGLLTAQSVAADSALAKVPRVLAPALARRLEALREAAVFTASGRAGTAPLVGVLLDLADAAPARRKVLLDYTSFLGEVTRRRLDPYGVVFHSGRWFVTGHDHTREALRTFRVDRVAAVGWAHEVRVVAHANPAEVRRRLPATVGTIEETKYGAAHRPRGAAGRHGAPARRSRPAVHRRGARRAARRGARDRGPPPCGGGLTAATGGPPLCEPSASSPRRDQPAEARPQPRGEVGPDESRRTSTGKAVLSPMSVDCLRLSGRSDAADRGALAVGCSLQFVLETSGCGSRKSGGVGPELRPEHRGKQRHC